MKPSPVPFVNPRDERDQIATLEYGLRFLEQRRDALADACRTLRAVIDTERQLARLPTRDDHTTGNDGIGSSAADLSRHSETARPDVCPDCDHGVAGGLPCQTCGGSGYTR